MFKGKRKGELPALLAGVPSFETERNAREQLSRQLPFDERFVLPTSLSGLVRFFGERFCEHGTCCRSAAKSWLTVLRTLLLLVIPEKKLPSTKFSTPLRKGNCWEWHESRPFRERIGIPQNRRAGRLNNLIGTTLAANWMFGVARDRGPASSVPTWKSSRKRQLFCPRSKNRRCKPGPRCRRATVTNAISQLLFLAARTTAFRRVTMSQRTWIPPLVHRARYLCEFVESRSNTLDAYNLLLLYVSFTRTKGRPTTRDAFAHTHHTHQTL